MDNLKSIFADVLGIDEEAVKPDTTRDVLEEWDSFSHLMLMNEIEGRLKIKFTMKEIEDINTFAKLEAVVKEKIRG